MNVQEIDAEIHILKARMRQTKSHVARIELEKRLADLQEERKTASSKEDWEM